MGRPLKIAKAQFLTMTSTSSSTNLVTVSNNLTTSNIVAGTPFTPNVNRGGLVAGTTYWILEVISASTFSVSAVQPSANPTNTVVSLTTSSTSTVLTVGAVDIGFSNPNGSNTATNGTSYGAVGGNTGIYGGQTVTRVAIGQAGFGKIATSSGSAQIFGSVDSLSQLSVGSAIQSQVANVNGTTTDSVTVGFVSSVDSGKLLAITSTVDTGDFIVTSGNAQTLANGVVWFDQSFGNITVNTPYYLGNVANATHFTVTATPGGATVPLASANVSANLNQATANLAANAAVTYATPVSYVFSTNEAGYINRQKGKQKYLVTGLTTGLTAQCTTANVANAALTPNTMSILATYANSGTAYVQSLSDYNSLVFTNSESNISNATPIIATFGTAYAANTYPGTNPIDGQTSAVSGQPYPIVTIQNS